MSRFISLAAWLALIGGGLRIAVSFIEHHSTVVWLEALYAVIDLSLLFGLVGIYWTNAGRTGALGLIGFMLALAGLASIVGPDATDFGVDFYALGSSILVCGLALFAVALIRSRTMIGASLCWLVAMVSGLGFSVLAVPWLFVIAGLSFSSGFVAAGLALIRQKEALASNV